MYLMFALIYHPEDPMICFSIFSVLNVGFTVIYQGINIYKWFQNPAGNNFMPQAMETCFEIQREVYFVLSLIGLLIVFCKRKHLNHVSEECLSSFKLGLLIILKSALFVLFFLDAFTFRNILIIFLHQAMLIMWFSLCIRIASTREIKKSSLEDSMQSYRLVKP